MNQTYTHAGTEKETSLTQKKNQFNARNITRTVIMLNMCEKEVSDNLGAQNSNGQRR